MASLFLKKLKLVHMKEDGGCQANESLISGSVILK